MNTKATLVRFPAHTDVRGSLTYGEVGSQLPFTPVRYFVITEAPVGAVRGQHAHLRCHELVVVVHGSCRTLLKDGAGEDHVTLDSPGVGLHVPPLVWIETSDYAPDTVVLVLASERYDEADYVRSFPEFLEIVAGS